MKDHSPLVPQGSFEAQARGKSRVKLAFYTIVVIHVLAIAGFLIIGCKREDKDAASNLSTPTNDTVTPPFGSEPNIVSSAATNTNPPAALNPGSALAATSAPASGIPSVISQPTNPSAPPAHTDIAEPAPALEHTIVKGDTFATLSTKYGVPVKAIQTANPGVDPTKLKIGQKVKIPPKTAVARNGSSVGSSGTGIGSVADAGDTYTVKSGDTLTTIAKNHHTTVKELQKLNGLSTTGIRVGQKLKLPPKAAVAPGAATSSGTAVPAPGAIPPAQ
jgi:LysM repeat protein